MKAFFCHPKTIYKSFYFLKLVAVNDVPQMKLSEEVAKINLPGKKDVYRLYSREGIAMLDLVQLGTEPAPKV